MLDKKKKNVWPEQGPTLLKIYEQHFENGQVNKGKRWWVKSKTGSEGSASLWNAPELAFVPLPNS